MAGLPYLCIMDISLNHRKNTIKSKSMKSITRQKQNCMKARAVNGQKWIEAEGKLAGMSWWRTIRAAKDGGGQRERVLKLTAAAVVKAIAEAEAEAEAEEKSIYLNFSYSLRKRTWRHTHTQTVRERENSLNVTNRHRDSEYRPHYTPKRANGATAAAAAEQ